MSRSLGPHTITVLVAGTTTDRGNNAVPNWAAATETTVGGCFVQPATATENTDGRDQRVTGWVLFAPGTTTLTALNRVRWNGLTFEVEGEVGPWSTSRSTAVHHIEANLRRVEG